MSARNVSAPHSVSAEARNVSARNVRARHMQVEYRRRRKGVGACAPQSATHENEARGTFLKTAHTYLFLPAYYH